MTRAKADTTEQQVVTFTLGKEEYAAPISKVREIIKMVDVTHLPDAPEFIQGIINIRGTVVPVIDLRTRLGLNSVRREDSRVILTEMGEKQIGLVVDAVSEVLTFPTANIELPPRFSLGDDHGLVEGIAKVDDRLIVLLDIEKLLSEREKAEIESL